MQRSDEGLKTLVVYNQGSGRSELNAERLSVFHTTGSRLVEFSREIRLNELIQQAVNDGFETVIAAGGDGTVNAVVNELISVDEETRPAMVILPLGTANDFALTLGIPVDIDIAISQWNHGNCIPIDVLRISAEGFER